MSLPDCLTKFDRVEVSAKPKRYYEVILSRPPGGMQTSATEAVYWSYVAPYRCVLTREALDDYLRGRFLACILREFDQLP